MSEDTIDIEPDNIEGMDVPNAGQMAQMPPEIAKTFAEAFANAIVAKQETQTPVLDIQSLPVDFITMVPQYGRWYWYKGWKRDPTDRNRIIYDIYVCPQKINKILAKSPEMIATRWGKEDTTAYFLWTVIKGRTYDPNQKRVVPIRQVMMTQLMARRGADVTKLLDKLTPDIIKRSVQTIEKHESLLWAEMAKSKDIEATTAWQIVDNKAVSHFKSTERMLSFAGEAEDKGDEEFSKSFTQHKTWKDMIMDNLCWIIILVVFLLIIVGNAQGWWS